VKTVTKYCDRKYHFDNAAKLQIGTLEYYRQHENDKIADPTEGLSASYDITNENNELKLPRNKTELLSGGAIKGTGIIMESGARMTFNQMTEIPNQYIFCVADEKDGNENTATSLGYESWYQIVDVDAFMYEVTKQLSSHALPLRVLVKSDQILCAHKEVTYCKDKQKLVDHVNFNILADAVFTKPTTSFNDSNVDYSLNNEYRMVWGLVDPNAGDLIPVKHEPILIDFTDELKKLCK